MLRLPMPTTAEPVRVPLAFAGFAAGLDVPTWRRYLASLDPADLPGDLLAELPHATVRPLSAADRDAAEIEAGPVSQLAAVVRRRIYEAHPDASHEDLAVVIDGLPDAERRALQVDGLRSGRLALARLRRALVSIDGEPGDPFARLQGLDEHSLSLAVVEVGAVLARISELSPEGKARAGRP